MNPNEPRENGRPYRKYLFIDDFHIERALGLERVWHHPLKLGKAVLAPDRPWEMGSPRTNYAAGSLGAPRVSTPVWNEAKRVWQLWYNGGQYGLPLYAESSDGIHWEKPELGLVAWEGSKRNNIYNLHGNGTFDRFFKRNGPCIVRDDHDPDPRRRYKGIIPPHMTRIVSTDGLTWHRLGGSLPAGDTFHMEYDAANQNFLVTAKLNITNPNDGVSGYSLPEDYLGGRNAWLYTSRDFENWSGPELAMYPDPAGQQIAAAYLARVKADPTRRQPLIDDPDSLATLRDWAGGDDGAGDRLVQLKRHSIQAYESAGYKADIYTMPVCEYEGVFLGFPTRMINTGAYSWWWDHGDRIERGSNSDGLQYSFLAYSRDLRTWNRQEEAPFVDTSPITDETVFDNGSAMGAVPVRCGDELRFYYVGFRFTHHQHHELGPDLYAKGGITPEIRKRLPIGGIFLARMRLDGFASLRARTVLGELTTRPIELDGGELCVNADAAGGDLRAELLDSQTGQPIAGYTLADAVPFADDSVDAMLHWRDKSPAALSGRPVKLRFELRNTDLYAVSAATYRHKSSQ